MPWAESGFVAGWHEFSGSALGVVLLLLVGVLAFVGFAGFWVCLFLFIIGRYRSCTIVLVGLGVLR